MTLRCQGLRARRGALHLQADFSVSGGPLVLVGPNGAGKTSLLLLLLGVLSPDQGRIEVADRPLFDAAARIDVPVEERQLGYVPQDYALFPHLTVRQNVEFALACLRPRPARRARAEKALALLGELGLEALAERRAAELSGGEKQRVALARALSVEPRALLLDEPLSAFDVRARRQTRAFLRQYLERLALPSIVVTHDAEDARALGSRVAVLEAGQVVQLGGWDELARQPASAFVAELVNGGR
jgi:molybdate transport system ATP-binding protein